MTLWAAIFQLNHLVQKGSMFSIPYPTTCFKINGNFERTTHSIYEEMVSYSKTLPRQNKNPTIDLVTGIQDSNPWLVAYKFSYVYLPDHQDGQKADDLCSKIIVYIWWKTTDCWWRNGKDKWHYHITALVTLRLR